mgnify:CR=1 FL=1
MSLPDSAMKSSTYGRVVDQRARWAHRGARFAERVAALDRAIARETSDPGYLNQFRGLSAVDLVVAAHTDDWRLAQKPVVHSGAIMPAARAVHRVRRESFRRTRVQAPRRPRPASVDSRPIRARQRSHRATQTRPQAVSGGRASPDPDPAPEPEPQLKPAMAAGGAR